MTEPVLTKEGQEVLEAILINRPPITQEREKKRIFRALSLIMNEQGAKEANRELVIDAAGLVLSPSFKSNFRRLEDPAVFKQLAVDTFFDRDAYYAIPIQVKRWDIPGSKAVPRPANMKVLAFCASPRVRGNTDTLIDEALRGAQDAGASVEKIRLQKIKFKFCTHCGKCREPDHKGFCVLKDDMSRYVYQKMVEANAIIIGFPIYIARECGQLAAFFDRWYCMPVAGRRTPGAKLGGRLGMVIGTWGAAWVDSYDHIIENIINVMHVNDIATVEAISACGFEGMFHGLDDKRKARIHSFPKELEKAYQAGKSLVTRQG
jgi:multimeric flavodoxin WrbA